MQFAELGKILVTAGVIISVLGLIFMAADKLPLGRLPGDLNFGRDGFQIFIPISTCLLISVVITLIVNFFSGK